MIDPAAFERVAALMPEAMTRFGVPGVALGVLHGGETNTRGFGFGNVEHPLPVDSTTLFRIASITKTFTATAIMRLVEQGKLALDVPLRRYLPDLRMAHADVAQRVTLRHCLNHYGGWTGDIFDDFGRGDDALARIVANMPQIPQLTPLGQTWSYNNVAFCLAGRAIELAIGLSYEAAIKELLLDPLGMERTLFFAEEAITHRVAAGHVALEDGPHVTRPGGIPRAGHAMGGLLSCVDDLFQWARFHMGDGTAPDGQRLLSRATLDQMQTPLAPGDSPSVHVGITWRIEDVGGTLAPGHGGSWANQLSTFRLVPSRDFAVIVLTNGDRGAELHGEISAAALSEMLDLRSPDMTHVDRRPEQLSEYAGTYTAVIDDVALEPREAGLLLTVNRRADLWGRRPLAPMPAPTRLRFYTQDDVVALDPPFKGNRGQFLRNPDDSIAWFRWGGRIHRRVR